MNRSLIETVMGAGVLVVAGFFLAFAYSSASVGRVDGYDLLARFDQVEGLVVGADVRIAGVKVGTVTDISLDEITYQAVVTLSVRDGIEVPADSAAIVASESLLGGRFLSVQPGGDEEILAGGASFSYTQSTPGLEALLGQVIFSLDSGDE